jgi:hypothetical protein
VKQNNQTHELNKGFSTTHHPKKTAKAQQGAPKAESATPTQKLREPNAKQKKSTVRPTKSFPVTTAPTKMKCEKPTSQETSSKAPHPLETTVFNPA